MMPPMPIAFDVKPSVSAANLPKWGADGRAGVKLLPAGCGGAGAGDEGEGGAGTGACAGYTQASEGGGGANEMRASPLARAVFPAVGRGSRGAGAPAPIARLSLRNGGALMPQDVGAPILTVRLDLTPVATRGGGDAPVASERFDVSFGVMWTPGNGAPPNNAGVFHLTPNPPPKEFVAYGVKHRLTITGLRPLPRPTSAETADDGGVAEGRPVWWKKDGGDGAAVGGYGAVFVPMDGRRYPVEVLAEVAVAD